MNQLIDRPQLDHELERDDGQVVVIEAVDDDGDVLHQLARRCRALLAKCHDGDCPPGHYLG